MIFVSFVSAQSSNQTYYTLAPGIPPSTDSGFFEVLVPFYAGCKWFYNSLLSGNGLNQNLITCKSLQIETTPQN